jgi:hypothetical protein
MSNSTIPASTDDIPICPPWWPYSLWSLHFPDKILHPGGPVNKPQIENQILLSLQAHTASYLMTDQAAAKQMRKLALAQLAAGVGALGKEQ